MLNGCLPEIIATLEDFLFCISELFKACQMNQLQKRGI